MSMKKTLWNLNKIKLFSYFDQNTLYIIFFFFGNDYFYFIYASSKTSQYKLAKIC